MKCVICGQADTTDTHTTITLGAIEIRNVPARICPQCGEKYVDEWVTIRLLDYAEGRQSNDDKGVAYFADLPDASADDQAAILDRIRRRRSFSPTEAGAPDSTDLLREDREL